jgi:ribosomal protein S21
MTPKKSKLPISLEEREELVDVTIKEGNKESILQKAIIENKKGEPSLISVEGRYILFKQNVEETGKIIEERYKLLYEEIEEKHKLKIKNDEDHYNRIVEMNDRSNYTILKLNIRQRHNGERSLKHEVGKLQNLNKKRCQFKTRC